MSALAIWRTDEPCSACGTALHATDTPAAVTLDCPACGWTATSDLATSQTGGSR